MLAAVVEIGGDGLHERGEDGIAGGAGDGAVEADVVDEVLLRIAERGVHLGDLFGELGDVLVGGAFGGQGGDVGLDDEARLEHLPGQEAVQRAEDGERAGVERGRAGGDEGSGAVAALEHAHGGEEADAGAEGGAADLQLAGEFAFGRKPVAGVHLAGGDQAADVLDDLQGELAVAVALVRLAPLASKPRPLSVCGLSVTRLAGRVAMVICWSMRWSTWLLCSVASRGTPSCGTSSWKMASADEVSAGGQGEDEQRVEREVVLDDPGEDGAADRSGGAADADDGGDGGRGEHVGGGGEEVGGPALVRGGGQRDEQRWRARRCAGKSCRPYAARA